MVPLGRLLRRFYRRLRRGWAMWLIPHAVLADLTLAVLRWGYDVHDDWAWRLAVIWSIASLLLCLAWVCSSASPTIGLLAASAVANSSFSPAPANFSSTSSSTASPPAVNGTGSVSDRTESTENAVVFHVSITLRMELGSAVWCAASALSMLGMSSVVFVARFLTLVAGFPAIVAVCTWVFIASVLFS